MNNKASIVVGVLCLTGAMSGPLAAHHSFTAGYDAEKHVTVTGAVKRFEYRSPHSLIFVDASGADGTKQSWVLEFGSPLLLSKAGWNAMTFKFGDVITAVGAPARTGAMRIYVSELKRAGDGFEYKAGEASRGSP